MTDEAVGVPVAPDDPWVAAKDELTVARSLTRIGTNARFTVSTVTVVGTALTALGLVTTDLLLGRPIARRLAVAATILAALAVVCALLYLALRLEKLNVENYVEVKAWYRRQFQRAWLVVAASWLLVGAVALASAAGVTSLVTADDPHDPVLTLLVQGAGNERAITAQAVVKRLRQGELVTMRVTSASRAAPTLLMGTATPDSSGTATLDASIDKAPVLPGYRLSVAVGGVERDSVTVP